MMSESKNKARMLVAGAITVLFGAVSLVTTLDRESKELVEKNQKLQKRNKELTEQLNRTEDELIICQRAAGYYDDPVRD